MIPEARRALPAAAALLIVCTRCRLGQLVVIFSLVGAAAILRLELLRLLRLAHAAVAALGSS